MRRVAWLTIALALAGCEAVLGLGDLGARPDASFDGSNPDAASGNDAVGDVSYDAVVKPDGGAPDGECNGGAEDCANGVDDNCDQLADCADPLCQGAGYACAPTPLGWSGPVALASATGETIPSCAGAYTTALWSGHSGLTATAATCGCSCSNPPVNVTCGGVLINYFSDACVSKTGSANLPPNFCVSSGTGNHVQGLATPTTFNGDCTSTPSKTVLPVTWSNSYAVCGYTAPTDTAGCTGGAQCVASVGGGLTGPCVYQAGDVSSCPGTPYTVKSTFYASIDDTRDCSTCACTASAGTCTGSINVYSAGGCTSSMTTIDTDGGCVAFSAVSADAPSVTTNAGTCGSGDGGTPIGSAVATTPITVCCPN